MFRLIGVARYFRDEKSAPIWSRLKFDPQSFEAPAPALIKKKVEPKSSSSSSETKIGAEKLQLQLGDK